MLYARASAPSTLVPPSRPAISCMRSRLQDVRLALFSIVLTLLACEIGLRILQKILHDTPIFAWLPGYRETRFALSPFLVFGPRIDWQIPGRQHPELAYFNRQGYRTREPIGAKHPGELRVVTLGGSTTEDVWNEEGTHWPLFLECRLHAAGRGDVRVLNGAMSAYSSAHSLVRLATDVPSAQPDLLVVMHNINDLTVNYYAAISGRPVDPNYLVKYGRKEYTGVLNEDDVAASRLLRFVRGRLHRPVPPPPASTWRYDLAAGRAIFERNLRQIVALARSQGVPVVLLTMPRSPSIAHFELTRANRLATHNAGLGLLPERARFEADFAAYNQAILDVGRATGAPVVPMHALMPADSSLFVDIVHYSARGSRAFAAALAPQLHALLRDPVVPGTRAMRACPVPLGAPAAGAPPRG